jgi:hypothetical protein
VSENFNNLLGGKSTPSASFKGQFPIMWDGTVEDVTRVQARDFKDNTLKFWPDGNPIMNVWVTLLTTVRDPEVQNDDGRRVLVLDSRNKLEAVQAAVRESGGDFAKGGRLQIEWYGNDPNGKNPDNLPKLYRARYTAPSFSDALAGPTGPAAPAQQATGGWGQQPSAPASPAPGTGGWNTSPAPTAPAGWGNAPAPQAAPAWGAQPAAPATTPAASPAAATADPWATAAPAPAPAASSVHPGLVEALRKKGYAVQPGMTQESAEGIWSVVQHQPDVA